MKKNNLVGQRFGKLLVLGETTKRYRGNVYWLCQCDCGNTWVALGSNLKQGQTRSCGCLRKEIASIASQRFITHGDNKRGKTARLYSIWGKMNSRCYGVNHLAYKYYGGRGISVCNEWKTSYSTFKFWAMRNGYQDNLTIDRVDNDGNYEPNNCQWITRSENSKKSNRERRRKHEKAHTL